jgi:hypothetical protein
MTLTEFRLEVRAQVVAAIPDDAPITANEDGDVYRRGALTVYVGEHQGGVALSYVAAPTALLGHSSLGVQLRLAADSVTEAARYVCSWLDDPYLHRHGA